jgi:hypothetical protein
MGRAVGPGRGSMIGLGWLAGVGPAPLDAWAVAMGWSEPTTFSHASRLISAGLAASCLRRRGAGSLLYATRSGVKEAGVVSAALAAEPAPTTWAHCDACAWVAAWLTARGRQMTGPRQLLADASWRGELEWMERGGLRRRGHRPDLLGGIASGGSLLPIEVELASKSLPRLRAILALHATWVGAGKTPAVIYVCGDGDLAERVRREAGEVGLGSERKTLRVELLSTVRDAAVAARVGDDRQLSNPTTEEAA